MSNEQFVEKFEELYRKYNPNKMEDEKQQPTPEQIAQWKKEARIHAGSNYKKNHFPKSWTDSYEGYFAGRQAAFDEYSKQVKIDSDFINKLEKDTIELAHELDEKDKQIAALEITLIECNEQRQRH